MKVLLGLAVAAASLAQAVDVVYVTDLSIYTMLAPCAQDALSYNIMGMTEELCPTAVDGLQSCVCSQSSYLSSISGGVSSSVSNLCGATATADQTSASSVLSAYCKQATDAAFPTPTPAVTQYITDIPELGFLALCASSQVANMVQALTDTLCPTDATALATCACQKDQNSLMISQSINTWVGIECDTHTADITSAQAFFSAYCNLNDGTSSFPSASYPPGDMSYYITDMPQYSSLASCARSAVASAVHSTAYYYCPTGGPQLLASCACIKPQMSSAVSVYVTNAVQRECPDDDTDDISSGLAVFSQYCSAARGEVVEAGITTSLAQTLPFGLPAASTGAGSDDTIPTATASAMQTSMATATATSGNGSGNASGTGSGDSGTSSNSGNSNSDSDSGSSKSGTSTGTIVGAVVGSVVGVVLAAVAAFFAWRRARANNARRNADQFHNLAPASYGGTGGAAGAAGGGFTKAELGGTPLSSATAVVLPLSAISAGGAAQVSELANHPERPAQELYGSGPRAEMPAEQSFQAGPVPGTYSELDGSGRRA